MLPLKVTFALLESNEKLIELELVIDVPEPKVPLEPLVMAMTAPLLRFVGPLKLYDPSALLNLSPTPEFAESVPVLKVNVPVWPLETSTSAPPFAWLMPPLYVKFTPPPCT